MKNYLILGLFIIASCTHKSELKKEKGYIVEKQFSPEFNSSSTDFGMSTNGGAMITTNTVHKPEQFLLVFKCEHNVIFTIDNKQLYTTLNKNDSVFISYQEILNKDNEVVDLDFVSAVKR